MPFESEQERRKASRNEDERAESEVSEIVFHGCVRGLDRPRRVIVTHLGRESFLHYFFCSTMSFFSPEIAASTSAFSFSGTLNLSSVATRCAAAAFQSASEIPIP
jgi:hypothetical protein